MNLQTIPYRSYEKGLPQEGSVILGQRRADTIFVYQAFNDCIADYAIKNQKFGGPDYNFDRMTWIKPNFLWMMYRSGWAAKDDNQSRILAIEMAFTGFEELLTDGVLTSYDHSYGDESAWRQKLNNSDVRIQWDPDHDFKGEKLKRRAVQIGIKHDALQKFNNEYIKSIQDITGFVKEQKTALDINNEHFFVMEECIVEINGSLKSKFAIPQSFISSFIAEFINQFENNQTIDGENFERLLSENNRDERNQFVNYIKNNRHPQFSRCLLRTAIAYRKGETGTCGCMCEDLLMFSFFVSKNKTAEDFDLIMEAKRVDFDTWCGFDGEMIFYTFGYEETKEYLKKNVEKFSQKTVDHFLEFDKDYLDKDIRSRAFWYL